MEPIAIVGQAFRFPGGANNPAKLWEVLNSQHDLSREADPDRLSLQKFYNANGEHHGSSNVTKSYFLQEDPRLFDTTFFNISPLEAEAMDPQQRLLLETVYEATAAAGVSIDKLRGSRCSVYVGVMTGDYETIQYGDMEDLSQYTASGSSRAILANRISYFFDLSGPSICLDTACSSSLVAMHLAVQDLRNGAADTAIVAGANLILGPDMYISESKLRMLSPTGKCQMWDALADGYARGEGVAALLLKPLSKAVRDNDPIQAVIRSSGVNSDGRTTGITMPSALAQARLTRETYQAAGLDPSRPEDRCQYFEAHGTGTQAGDPTEARGIFESFFSSRDAKTTESSTLCVGSIKTIVGHLEGCAGIAGVIKVLLAMKHNTIPPNLHLKSLNPKIQPFQHVLKVPTKATPWPAPAQGQPKRASVNSFGFGGTNAHVVLESYDTESSFEDNHPAADELLTTPIVISGHSQTSLLENIRQFTQYLRNHPDVSLQDVAWTLWARRSAFAFRKSFSATSRKDLFSALETAISESTGTEQPSIGNPASTLVSPSEGFGALGIFTGQGAQWPGMGKELLQHSSVFRKAIEECERSLAALPDAPSWSLKQELLADTTASRISEAEIAQPATTAVEIGLARMIQECGIKFTAVVGHSSGEIAGLYAAGILSLSDAIRIAFYRGLYAKLAGKGAMMAVGISAEAARAFCREDRFRGRICLAAKNSPSSVTLSGDADAIQEAKEVFDDRKLFARVLKTDKAYHSPHMEACSEAYLAALRKCGVKPLKTGQCVWVSSVDGTAERYWDHNLDDLSGPYWIENMIKPVLFADACTTALTNGGPFDMAIEVGPHPALKGPVNQTVRPHLGKQLLYCGSMNRGEDGVKSVLDLLGFIWTNFGAGVLDIDGYERCWREKNPIHKVIDDLPAYAWDHTAPIWRESRLSRNHRLRTRGSGYTLLGQRCVDDSDWEPRWRNFLSLKELPWLRGHAFQGEVLFPAAGYVAMMLEVAHFLSDDRPISLIEINDLTLERPSKVQDGLRPVEMLTSVRVTSKGGASGDKVTADFSAFVCSDAAAGAIDRTCFGSISVSFGEACDNLFPQRVDPLPATVSAADPERFYSSVGGIKLEYNDQFRRLDSIRRVDGIATATASWSADEIEYDGLYHPALIDVTFQPIFAAFNAPTAERLWTAYLPQTFRRITFNLQRRLTSSPTRNISILIDAFTTKVSAAKMCGDISVYSPDDGFSLPLFQIEGITLAALERPDASNDRVLFAETIWEADLLGGADFTFDYDPTQDVVVEDAERVAQFFARKLLSEASKVGVDNLKPHEKLLFEQLKILVGMSENGSVTAYGKAAPAADSRETIDAILARNQDRVDFELMRLVGDEAGSVFRNEKQMVHVLFADDKLSHFYRDGLGLRELQRQVSAYMRAISHRYPKANILELGAGTGATTSAIFDAIGDHFGTYTFTDVSLAFFPEAQTMFAEHAHKMSFKKLDIGRPFGEQGFDTPSYDVVIAANVLHVSEDIEAVLQRARGLLKPGGFLVVMEPTYDALRVHVIMGGLEGWWLARDNCRRFGPMATVETWDEKLRSSGFTGIDLLGHDMRDERLRCFSSFVSQATDHTINALREPLDHEHVLPESAQFAIIGGSALATSKTIRLIRDRLSRYGNSVVHFPDVRSIRPSDLPPQAFVLCLAELDQPTFKNGLDEAVLSGLKCLFEKCRAILMVTKNDTVSSPFSNMMVGLFRGLSAEKPSLSGYLQIMDLDGNSKQDANTFLQHFLRLVFSASYELGTNDRLWSLETEISLRHDQLFIPRIQEDEEPNHRTNSARRRIVKDVTTETHVVEVSHTQGTPEVRASLKIISERSGLETISVDLSSLTATSVLPYQPQYLCLGTLQDETKSRVLALSSTNTSVVQVPKDQTFALAEGNFDAERLGLMALILAAQAWVRAVPNDHAIWTHGLDDMVVDVLKTEAKKRNVSVFTSSTNPAHRDYIQPCIPTRVLKSMVPAQIAAIIFGTSVSETGSEEFLSRASPLLSLRKPLSGYFFDCPSTWSETPGSRLLELAYNSAVDWSGSLNTVDAVSVVPVGKVDAVSGDKRPLVVVDWRQTQTTTVKASLQPLNHWQLFKPDRTYLMVGLTGEVGLSICTWMIKHGVRNVVLTSRQPKVSQTWIDSMSKMGANISVVAMDVTNPDRVKDVVDEISKTMPPIAGVCNGAMVLSDKPFMQMDLESMNTVLGPKVQGSINLDRIFTGHDLDFFIMLSSLACIIGSHGQSNYHMANTFMAGLAADRRRRGLAGSVIHVGMISDIGYLTRQDPTVAQKLRMLCVLSMCEPEVHDMFAESILAGRPDFSSHGQLITGLGVSDNEAERPPWATLPRFGFYVRDKRDLATGSVGTSVIDDLRSAMESAGDVETVFQRVVEAFSKRLEGLLQLPQGAARMDLPLVSLGLDSLLAMEVQTWFRKVVGTAVSVLEILGGASGQAMCRKAANSVFANKSNSSAPNQGGAMELKIESTSTMTESSVSTLLDATPSTTGSSVSPPSDSTLSTMDGSDSPLLLVKMKLEPRVVRQGPMSYTQGRFWFFREFLDDPTSYNETAIYEIHGRLDVGRLESAFQRVLSHHEVLRTRFYNDKVTAMPMQAVMDVSACQFRFVDHGNAEVVAGEYEKMKTVPWDLEAGLCLAVTVISHSADKNTFIMGAHHILIDGISWVLFLGELSRAYQHKPLEVVPQYLDYSQEQRKLIESGGLSHETAFWKAELAGMPEALPLFPMSHAGTRKATNRYDSTVVRKTLTVDVNSRIKAACRQLRTTAYQFHFSVLFALVSRLSRTTDICIGTIDAGRWDSKYQKTIGVFINLIPVRVLVDQTETFESLCTRVSKKALDCMQNANTPLDALVDQLKVSRNTRHAPLFQIFINYRLGNVGQTSIGDCRLEYTGSRSSNNPHDMYLSITEAPDGTCYLDLTVQDALYSTDAAETILESYCRLLNSASANSASKLSNLLDTASLTASHTDADLIQLGSGPRWDYDWEETVSRQIEKAASLRGDAVAVKDAQGSYTYNQLMTQADGIAATLLNTMAVMQPAAERCRCCLLFEPSVDYVSALLAAMKISGVIAVSLDPDNHPERLAAIIQDCEPAILLHHGRTSQLAGWLKENSSASATMACIDVSSTTTPTNGRVANTSSWSEEAVVFHTSGTTGVPKGAKITHGNYREIIAASTRLYGIRFGEEVILQQTAVTFDVNPWQILTALCNAGTLVITTRQEQRDPYAIASILEKHRVSIMFGTPSEFSQLVNNASDTLKRCPVLRAFVAAGEAFSWHLAGQLSQLKQDLPQLTVFNAYGTAETCIICTSGQVDLDAVAAVNKDAEMTRPSSVPVGRALPNCRIYILGDAGTPLGPGCTGEVCIAGAGVGSGYWKLPEGTPDPFVPDSFVPPEDAAKGQATMYRTGDRGYLLKDGSVVVLGRIEGSSQVKVRGVRIELDDIAANIVQHSGGKVAEAVASARGEGEDKFLVAFAVLARGAQLDPGDLQRLARTMPVPQYMRPAVILPLDQLPLTANAKLDRRALDRIPISSSMFSTKGSAEVNETLSTLELELGSLWQEMIPDTCLAADIHKESDFFDHGGNSMALVRLRKRLQKRWNVQVSLVDLFEMSTLSGMAEVVRGAKDMEADGSDWEFWDRETHFEPSQLSVHGGLGAKDVGQARGPKTVLLAGAHLLLGDHLLKELLVRDDVGKIHCIALSPEEAARLPINSKIEIHHGALGAEALGLSRSEQTLLRDSVDIIIHAAAEGSCLNSYKSMRVKNVESTKFLARNLALPAPHVVPFHYISVARVVLFSGQNSWPESSVSRFYPPGQDKDSREGFTSTRWASERFLENVAAATGLPVSIHRPGYLTSLEDMDRLDPMDAINMIHKYVPEVQAVPAMANFRGWIDMVDARDAARRIVSTILDPVLPQQRSHSKETGAKGIPVAFRHYTGRSPIPVEEFRSYMEAQTGCALEVLPMSEWARRAEKKGMSPFLAEFLIAVVEKAKEARYPQLLYGNGTE